MKKKRTPKRLTDELIFRRVYMRLKRSLLLLAVMFLAVQTTAFSQTAKVSVDLKEISLAEVFTELGKQAGIVFLYDYKLVASKGKVTLKAESKELEKVLKEFLTPLGLTFVCEDNVVIIRAAQAQTFKTARIITGVVTDEYDQPLPGVHVVIKGSHAGGATDRNGEFKMAVDSHAKPVLVLSFIGKQTQEVKVTEKDNYKVILPMRMEKFEDVVVTGYQTFSRERSAGSFSRVSGEDVAQKANLTGNILETLEGLTPGLSVNYGIGEDKFLIRGTTSINSSTEPLIVVDGVVLEEGNIEELVNSTDVESVTFLKDATSASIWGARAANGVIVITTKSGKTGDRHFKVSYDGSFTYKGLPDFEYRKLMNSEQVIRSAVEIFDPVTYPWANVTSKNGGALVYPHEMPLYRHANGEIDAAERDRQLRELAGLDNRSQVEKYLQQPALFTKHTVSFSGAANIYSLYGSVGYEYNQDVERAHTNKVMLNFKHTAQLKKWLKVDLTTNLSVQNRKTDLMPSYTDVNSILPYEMLADEQGNPLDHSHTVFYKEYQDELEAKSLLDLSYVPLDDMHEGFNKAKLVNGRINLGIAAQIAPGLKYEGRFQYQQNYSKSELFYSQNSVRVRVELARFTKPANPPATTSPTYYLPTTGGHYTLSNTDGINWTVRNQLNYDRAFGREERSQITALAGMEVQSNFSSSHATMRRGYDPQSQTYQAYDEKELETNGISGAVYSNFGTPRNTLKTKTFTQNETERRFVSLYSNVAYTYDRKYTFNGSIRVDQSNLYGSDPSVQFKPVWSVGVAWNLKQEEFLDRVEFLDRLNFRFSYGLGGNSPKPGKGGPYNLLESNTNSLFSGQGIGYAVMYPANDKIQWERTRTINAGIDVSAFHNRITASIDVYHKLTTDLLATKPTDQTLGWENFYTNFGDMKNQGFEVSLKTRNISSRNFTWTSLLTLTNNRNKVLKLNLDGTLTASRKVYFDYVEGYAGNSLFAYRWAGLNAEGNPQVYNAAGEAISNYQDESLTEAAVRFIGVTQPKWYGALTNSFSWKGFDLSFMFVYNFGHKLRRDVNNFWYGRLARNVSRKFLDRWREAGDEAHTDVPKYVSRLVDNQTKSRNISFYEFADVNVLDASYVKLRDVTLSYALPRRWCDKLSADRISLRAQASNLLLIAANHDGIDPEFHQYRNGLRGTKYGPSWSVGLTVNFK